MIKYKNTWGFYNWNEAFDDDTCIHPADFESLKNLFPVQKIFYCIDISHEYLVLRYENICFIDQRFRVKPCNYEQLPEPYFKLGDNVKIKSEPTIIAEIGEIGWHFKQKVFIYYLIINKKKKSKRYWMKDLDNALKGEKLDPCP